MKNDEGRMKKARPALRFPFRLLPSAFCLLPFLLAAAAALALPPAQVQQRIASGEKITFVDVRPTSLFQQGHIPGAINVPAGLVLLKELPPLGHVVVYDDGLGVKAAETAAAALNKKPGITADVLDGGFAAWETAKAPTTKAAGMKPEVLPVITYAQLKDLPTSDLVLVDLRKRPDPTAHAENARAPALTDLAAAFPKTPVVRSPFEATTGAAHQAKSATATTPPLLVLIDSGDGAADAMARTLKANGVARFAILAGGEEILARKGEKGLQRLGSTIEVHGRLPTPPATNPKAP